MLVILDWDGTVCNSEARIVACMQRASGRAGLPVLAPEVIGNIIGLGLPEARLMVLDPPRSGAGGAVLQQLHRLRPAAIAYVACDPAALARDLRILADLGWAVTGLRALDMFPMTHHIEAVAALRPASADLPP